MAKIRVAYTKTAVHGIVPLPGLREVTFDIGTTEKEYGSDGEPLQIDIVDFRVTGEAVFDDLPSYNLAIANVEASLALTTESGTPSKVITAKNCKFTGARIMLPTRQDRGVGTYRCPLRLQPGAADTPQSMITVA